MSLRLSRKDLDEAAADLRKVSGKDFQVKPCGVITRGPALWNLVVVRPGTTTYDVVKSETTKELWHWMAAFQAGIEFAKQEQEGVPYGVSPSESSIRLPSGNVVAFEAYDPMNPEGTSYVRVLDKNGGELGYWESSEWGDDPEDVMGAIMGAMKCPDQLDQDDQPEKFYQFCAETKFPAGVKFEKYGD